MFITFRLSKLKLPATVLAVLMLLMIISLILFPSFSRGFIAVVTANRLVPIYAVDTPEQKVAISFDATWGADYTSKILDILDEYNIKTTFFLCGRWIEEYPEKTQLISERGHEIGNHSLTHPHMNTQNRTEHETEIMETHRLIYECTNQESFLFRCPFGEYNNTVIESCNAANYMAIQWDVDSLDWREYADTNFIYNRVTSRVKPGSIVLFHNNGEHTAEALPNILQYLVDNEYEVVPISELLYRENYYIDPISGLQKQIKQ